MLCYLMDSADTYGELGDTAAGAMPPLRDIATATDLPVSDAQAALERLGKRGIVRRLAVTCACPWGGYRIALAGCWRSAGRATPSPATHLTMPIDEEGVS